MKKVCIGLHMNDESISLLCGQEIICGTGNYAIITLNPFHSKPPSLTNSRELEHLCRGPRSACVGLLSLYSHTQSLCNHGDYITPQIHCDTIRQAYKGINTMNSLFLFCVH